MNAAERKLAEMRAARDAARGAFERRLGQAKEQLAPATIRKRVVADARHKAMEVATEAIEIANDSRGVVIATGALLALWLARKPIGKAVMRKVEPWLAGGTSSQPVDWIKERIAARFARKPAPEATEDQTHD